MAECGYCDREMTTADGCTLTTIAWPDGPDTLRIRYGFEERFSGEDLPERCHDCGCLLGALHHPACDMEECPRCHLQLLSCDCAEEARIS